jgi:hypothetical protein
MFLVTGEPVRGEETDDGGVDGQPLFGRLDAATLLAVEGANGGEWAGLGQVIVTFNVVFGQSPDVDQFTESCRLLCEAGLIEYVDEGLTLAPAGRKLLRRAGSRRGAGRPQNVTELLEVFDELDLAAEGSVPEPAVADIAAALEGLTTEVTDGLERVQASNANWLAAPSPMLPVGHVGLRADVELPFAPIDPSEGP